MELIEENTILLNEGVVTQVMLNRPDALNAINIDVFQSLILTFERLERFPDLRVVTMWGAGEKAFAVGTEAGGFRELGRRALADYVELGNKAYRTVEKCPVPVIAGVNGLCLGAGLELALAADIIVSSSEATFSFPEVSLGGLPTFGGMARLCRRVGVGIAKKMIFSGEMISAEKALQIGLIDEVAEKGKLTNYVDSLAEEISKQAPLAVRAAKKLLQSGREELGQSRENIETYLDLAKSADWEEGLDAFMERRTPRFTGR